MDFLSTTTRLTHSGASTPSASLFPHSSIGTPETSRSLLFDDVPDEPLELGDNRSYVLVVGGLGYIGSHTTLELLKASYNVIIIDDLSNSYKGVYDRVKSIAADYCKASGKSVPECHLHEMDYRSQAMRPILSRYSSFADLKPQSKISGVIHFAAFKSVEESIRKPLEYYQNNVCGLVDFLSVLQGLGIKNFVFSSSATIYGTLANCGQPLREELCVHKPESYVNEAGIQKRVEQGVSGLTSPYGRTKWMCEAILADFAHSDPSWNITALRYFNPVGCHESGLLGELPRQKPSNLMPVIANVLKGKSPQLEIFGTDWDTTDGTAVRDYIHVVDLARGHIAAMKAVQDKRVTEPFRTFNLGSGSGHTVREVVDSIERASCQKIAYSEVGRRDGDVGFCVARVNRASTELGWKTEKTLADCAVDLWRFTEAAIRTANQSSESSAPPQPTNVPATLPPLKYQPNSSMVSGTQDSPQSQSRLEMPNSQSRSSAQITVSKNDIPLPASPVCPASPRTFLESASRSSMDNIASRLPYRPIIFYSSANDDSNDNKDAEPQRASPVIQSLPRFSHQEVA